MSKKRTLADLLEYMKIDKEMLVINRTMGNVKGVKEKARYGARLCMINGYIHLVEAYIKGNKRGKV